MRPMTTPPLPRRIGPIEVPEDDVSAATWAWVHRSLPGYLVAHSIRSYCWGVAIAEGEGWRFDRRILWVASLLHDLGLARLTRNTMCFEVEGAEIARRFLEGHGLPPDEAERAAIAIILHMRAGVTLADRVESVLLDRATGVDVRGAGIEAVAAPRDAVVRAYPRGAFDRLFLRAIEREVAIRPGCQSERLLVAGDLAGWMARSAWATAAGSSSRPAR